jgi:hypothetical protein
MRMLPLIAAGGALLALGGCEVNVTSNDAATRNAIEDVQQGAADLAAGAGNVAGAVAADLGNEIGEAARDAGNTADRVGDAVTAEKAEQGGNKAQ